MHSQKKSLLISLALVIFFAFFYLTAIPFALQYDVMTNALTPELFLKGIYHVSIRQKIQYFILGGYFQYYFIEFVRFIKAFWLIPYILRLPSAIFFILGSWFWYKILKLFKFSNLSILAFFIVLTTSPVYIWYSHHIPLVAGYFFYSTAGMYFLFGYLKNTRDTKALFFSLFLFILASYTHGLSVILTALLLFFALIYLVFIKKKDLILAPILARKYKLILGLVVLFIIGLPFLLGFLGTDKTLGNRPLLITYLLKYGELKHLLEQLWVKFIAYVHPASLVYAGKVIPSWFLQKYQDVYLGVQEHLGLQWWFNGISPFGYIGAVVYFVFIWAIYKVFIKKDKHYALFLLLIILYLLLPVVANYDNPSIAKTIPVIMFIPLGVALLVYEIAKFKDKFIIFIAFLLIVINSIYNLGYLYAKDIKAKETQPYDTYFYQEALVDLAPYIDFAKTNIYFIQPEDPKVNAAFALYYSPDFLYHMYWVKNLESLVLENNDIVITSKQVTDSRLQEILHYYNAGINENLYIYANKNISTAKAYVTKQEIKTVHTPYKYKYINEFLKRGVEPNTYNFKYLAKYNIIDIETLLSKAEPMPNIILGSNNNTVILPAKLVATSKQDYINVRFTNIPKGWYLLTLKYRALPYATIDFWCIDNLNRYKPLSILPFDYTKTIYKTAVYVFEQPGDITCSFNVLNNHLNISKDKHKVQALLNSIEIRQTDSQITKDFLLQSNITGKPANIIVKNVGLYTYVYNIPKDAKNIVLNTPYNSQAQIVTSGKPFPANFSAYGIQLNSGNTTLKIFHKELIVGFSVFIAWLSMLIIWILIPLEDKGNVTFVKLKKHKVEPLPRRASHRLKRIK